MDKKKLTKKGGEKWIGEGFYTTNHDIPREWQVKHYAESYDVHVAIGAQNFTRAKGAIGLSIEQGEELAEAIYEACEEARKFLNA